MNPQSKIILIGGSGFIGSALARKLKETGYMNVFSLSRSPTKSKLVGIQYSSGADITKPESLAPHVKDAEVIFNLAGLISFSSREKRELHEINVAGAKNVVNLCSLLPNLKRLIHLSSTAALGFSENAITEEHDFHWDEYRHLHYSHSKMVVNEALNCANMPTNIIFPPMVLGPGDRKNTGNIFKYVGKKHYLLAPPGSNSFVDVRDLAAALILVMEKAQPNENYIIASGAHSYTEVFFTAAKIRGNDPKIFVLPNFFFQPAHKTARILERFLANVQAEQIFLGFKKREHDAKRIFALGFKPQYSLQDSLRDYWSGQGEEV